MSEDRSTVNADRPLITRSICTALMTVLVLSPLKTFAQGGPDFLDKATGLSWHTSTGAPDTWDNAAKYCKSFSYRLPTNEDMRSIWQGSHFVSSIHIGPEDKVLWTSDTQGDKAQVFVPNPKGGTFYLLPQSSTKPVPLCVHNHHFWERDS